MLWDDEYFYVAADLEEAHVWATLTKLDAVIFNDPDFEVFIDPNAESVLLEACEALKQDRNVESTIKQSAITRLIQLYETWDKSEKVTQWQQRRSELQRHLQAAPKNAADAR